MILCKSEKAYPMQRVTERNSPLSTGIQQSRAELDHYPPGQAASRAQSPKCIRRCSDLRQESNLTATTSLEVLYFDPSSWQYFELMRSSMYARTHTHTHAYMHTLMHTCTQTRLPNIRSGMHCQHCDIQQHKSLHRYQLASG